jgi:SAM-dependent methyltransferase
MALRKEEIHKGVSEFYAGLIKEKGGDCCTGCCSPETGTAEKVGYTKQDLEGIPQEAGGSSFGCGNPLAFAEVEPGETVLDLGSGGGIDCFLAADRVGESGRVIGLDMTEEMVEKATKTAEQNGYGNVEFRLGQIEEMPVETASVDWVISNCVINLSPEKGNVFSETFRVPMREDISAWAGCVSGAVTEGEYLGMIRAAGFEQVEIVDRLDYVNPSEEQPYKLASIRVKGIKK